MRASGLFRFGVGVAARCTGRGTSTRYGPGTGVVARRSAYLTGMSVVYETIYSRHNAARTRPRTESQSEHVTDRDPRPRTTPPLAAFTARTIAPAAAPRAPAPSGDGVRFLPCAPGRSGCGFSNRREGTVNAPR